MELAQWTRIDGYFEDAFIGDDEVLKQALADAEAAEMPAINVTAAQGKFLGQLVRIMGAKNVLEIGTLAGFSAIWMARNLPEGGKLTTLEYETKHAEVARKNIARAGLSDKVEIIVGAAIETLPTLEDCAPFDLFFIDADKQSAAAYFAWSMKLARPGSVIIVDNVVRGGEVINEKTEDEMALGIQRFVQVCSEDPRAYATTIQTVGAKGYDGFTMIVVE